MRDSPSLEQQRKQTLAELESLHGTRTIGPEEYRRRAEVARRAVDEAELESVRPSPNERAPARGEHAHPAPAREPSPDRRGSLSIPEGNSTGIVLACLGSSIRKGPWEPPETLYCLSLMGGVELDFREAALLEGITEVIVLAVMGGAKIVVPDDVDVEVNGIGLMGGFEHVSHHPPGEDRPLIRIKGLAVMGGVSVKVKRVGPTATQRIAKRVRDLI